MSERLKCVLPCFKRGTAKKGVEVEISFRRQVRDRYIKVFVIGRYLARQSKKSIEIDGGIRIPSEHVPEKGLDRFVASIRRNPSEPPDGFGATGTVTTAGRDVGALPGTDCDIGSPSG